LLLKIMDVALQGFSIGVTGKGLNSCRGRRLRMSTATTLNMHAFLSKIALDGVHTEVVDVPCVGDGVVLLTQTLHKIHDDPSVVNVLPYAGEQALKSIQAVQILETGLMVRMGLIHILLQLSETV
jgi:hypothetical protein